MIVYEFFRELLNKYNNLIEVCINSDSGMLVLKLVVGLIAFIIVANILKRIIDILKKIIRQIIRFAKRVSQFTNDETSDEMQKEFLAAPLIRKRDFLWFFRIFSLKERERIISLIKSSIIFLLNPKYLKKYFCRSITADSEAILIDENVSLEIKSFVAIPNKVVYAELVLKNKKNTDICFSTAKGKQKDIMRLNLYSKGKLTHECVDYEDIDNLPSLLDGKIGAQSEMLLKVYFQTIDMKTIREIESMTMTGALRFKGTAKYKNYEVEMNISKSVEDENFEKKMQHMMGDNEWIDIFEQGGLVCFITMFVLFLFLVSIFIEFFLLRMFLLLVSLALYIIAVPLNVAIVRFVLKFKQEHKYY